MGIIGTGLDLRAARAWGYAGIAGESVIAIGITVFIILTVRWLLRIRSDRNEIHAESSRALTANYYATIGISLALTAAAIAPYCAPGAGILWLISAIGGAALLLYLLGNWIQSGIPTADLAPAVFLPIVGNAATVYVAADAGVEQYAWFSFSLAIVCWLALVPLVLYRLIAVEPRLPRKLAPQFAIFVASPAVLANAWFVLDSGQVDALFKILACVSLFFALLTVRLWRLAWGEPFNVAMWGWTFPAAVLAGSFERLALTSPSDASTMFALALLWLAVAITLGCTIGAVHGWLRGGDEHEIRLGAVR